MRHFWDIVKGVLASALVAIVVAVDLTPYCSLLKPLGTVVPVRVANLLLASLLILVFFIYALVTRRPLRVCNGRSGAMQSNLKILKRTRPRHRTKKYVLSTRVSFWPVLESDLARQQFREELTKKIRDGYRVWRIWQIHSDEDFSRLLAYLDLYKTYDNYSVKCFAGETALIPEILSVGGQRLSVSIPQAEDPRRLTTAFHFRGQPEVVRWENYFMILWEHSIPIKVGSYVHPENIELVRQQLQSTRRS